VARRTAFFLLIPFSTATAAVAQAVDPTIDQITNSSPSVELGMNAPEEPRSTTLPAQLAKGSDSAPAAAQVTKDRRPVPPEQLSTGGKTAQPSQPLSKPADGRQSAVERIAGADQCDPADPKRSRAKCATVIENRASEFARSNSNELSPEQRLLLEQEVREGALNAQGAARRLAVTGRADTSLEAMGVAATAIRPTEESRQEPNASDDIAKAAEVVGAILNTTLTPPQ
jgi:hypothetical protein